MTDNPAAVRCSVGIDISKDSLDIFIDAPAEGYRAANRADDIAALVERLRAAAPDYIVVEASGGFESAAVSALATAGLPVCRVPPQRVRSFARVRRVGEDRPARRPAAGALRARLPPTAVTPE